MQPFTFIHAADLHLDAILPGPKAAGKGEDPALDGLLKSAVFTALKRLEDLCIARDAAFLLLSGDVFHQGEGSLKANLELRDTFLRLAGHGVKVFWARGNHDPDAGKTASVNWPDNLHIFSTEGETVQVERAGYALALVQGISHSGEREKDNLARRMHGLSREASLLSGTGTPFRVGVLHCAVRGKSGKHDNYAPCAVEDLQGNDYWALGHVHARSMPASDPQALYPGSLQGLHINEDGPHGCAVIQVDASGRAGLTFENLAPLRWEKLAINIGETGNVEDENQALLDTLEDETLRRIAASAVAASRENGGYALLGMLFRIDFTGRGRLDSTLRRGGNLEEFTLRLNRILERGLEEASGVLARIKDIRLSSAPDVDMEALRQSDNLVGETLRVSSAFAAMLPAEEDGGTDADMLDFAQDEISAELADLYHNKLFRRYLGRPGMDELSLMAGEAANLCLDLFEVE